MSSQDSDQLEGSDSSSSRDSWGYDDYYNESFEDESDRRPLTTERARLLTAVVQQSFDEFKQLLEWPRWYKVKDKEGNDLLQVAILHDNIEVFDHLLSIDYPLEKKNDSGETALVTALACYYCSDSRDLVYDSNYFASELIKRGANIHVRVDSDTSLLHTAVERQFTGVAQLLIENGVDIDSQEGENGTPLLTACWNYEDNDASEEVAMLLFYNADPSICDSNGFSPFDAAMLGIHGDLPSQESLFFYTFDQYTKYEIPLAVLLTAAKKESPLFYQIVDKSTDVIFDCLYRYDYLDKYMLYLFTMKSEFLKVLIEKFDYAIREMLNDYKNVRETFNTETLHIENFRILIESKLKSEMIEFILKIKNYSFMEHIIKSKMSESTTTELVCYLLSYGMSIHESHFQTIYRKFGYCDLIKILLHMDLEKDVEKSGIEDIMPRLITDVNFDVQEIINNPELYRKKDFEQFLHYYAHPKLKDFCCSSTHSGFSDRVKDLPQIPSLVELARNAFRRYFITSLRVTNARQFYTLLNLLPISASYLKIITLETKLY